MTPMTPEEKKALKNRGFLPTTDGNCSARIITVNGKLTADQTQTLCCAARQYGTGQLYFTTRLTVEVPGIDYKDVEDFAQYIAKAGLSTGGTGSRVRPIVCCKGSVCVHGLQDTFTLAEKIHEVFYKGWYDVKLPHKFKIGISACPNACVKPQLNEFGLIAQKVPAFDEDMCNGCKRCAPMEVCPMQAFAREGGTTVLDTDKCNNCGKCVNMCPFDCVEEKAVGYKITIGGKWGKHPRPGDEVPGVYTESEVMRILEKTLLVYREQGKTGERMGAMVERIGTENFIRQILSDEVLERKQQILDAPLHLVGGATC